MRKDNLQSMGSSPLQPELDAVLARWRDSNVLTDREAQAISRRIHDSAIADGLGFGWWKDCLSAGLEPLKATMGCILPSLDIRRISAVCRQPVQYQQYSDLRS